MHVDAKTDIRDLELVVPARDGVITGQVVETNGKPVSHAFVFAAREEGTAGSSDLGGRPVQTDNAGRFTVPNLADGTYTVSAEYPRGGPHGMRKGIRVGQSTTVTRGRTARLHVGDDQSTAAFCNDQSERSRRIAHRHHDFDRSHIDALPRR